MSPVFAIYNQFGEHDSYARQSCRDCRRHESKSEPLVDNNEGKRFSLGQEPYFAEAAVGDCRRNSPEGRSVAVVSMLITSKPCPSSVSMNCPLIQRHKLPCRRNVVELGKDSTVFDTVRGHSPRRPAQDGVLGIVQWCRNRGCIGWSKGSLHRHQ